VSKKKKTKSKKEEKHSAYSDIIPEKKKKIVQSVYEKQLRQLQIELVKLQRWIHDNKLKVVVIFEGRDAAGKGSVIKRIIQRLNPRICRVVALTTPTERETTQ
jgi:polyphosphate kinase 2 (PPK2 family)